MAQYPIDIKLDTGSADRDLKNLNAQLDQTEKSTIAAAQAANDLSTAEQQVSKAAQQLAQEQVNQAAKAVAAARAARELAQEQSRLLATESAVARAKGESVNNQQKYVELSNQIKKATEDEKSALESLTNSLTKANNARRNTETARELKANEDLIKSLREQIHVSGLSNVEAAKYRTAKKLNASATEEQREEVAKLTEELERMNKQEGDTSNADATSSPWELLLNAGKALIALQVGQTVLEWGKAFVDTSQKIELLQSRIKLYSNTAVESQQIFEQLTQQANKSGTDIEAVAGSFQRFAAAGKDAGISNQVILQFTDNLQKMARISGASSAEASAAIYQLSQAFASGRLQGDEFRSVSEQLPTVLQVLAKQMGVTTGELKRLGSDGDITRDKLLLLNNATEDINTQFDKMPRTVDQSATALRNNLSVAIAELDQQIGASKFLAKFLDLLAGGVSGTTELIKAAADTDKLAQATNNLNSVNSKREANLREIASLEQQIQKGFTAQSTGGYLKFSTDLTEAQAKLNNLKKIDVELTKQQAAAQRGIAQATPLPSGVAGNLATQASQLSSDLTAAANKGRPDAEAQKYIETQKEQIDVARLSGAEQAKLIAIQKLGKNATEEQIKLAKEQAVELYNLKEGKKEDKKATSEAASAAKRAQKELERNQAANEKYLKTLNDKVNAGQYDVQLAREQVQLSLTQGASVDQLTAAYQKSYQVQQQLTLQSQQAEAQSRLNKDATDAERKAVDEQVAALQRQQEAKRLAAQVSQVQSDVTSTLNPVQGQMDQINQQEAQRLTVAEQARQQDLINEQQYQDLKTQIMMAGEQQRNDVMTANNAMLLGATGDLFGGLADVLKNAQGEQSSIYKTMFAASKAFAIAQASVLLWQNVSKAMAIGFPQNIPFIAGALAQGTSILTSLSSVAATGFATGGLVTGPGTGQSDSINARLSNGEFVSTKQATSRYRDTLESMNRGTYTPGSEGGSGTNVQVHNYAGERVQVKQGLTRDDVVLIIGEEFPRQSAAQWNNPYSQTNKSFRSNYDVNRKL